MVSKWGMWIIRRLGSTGVPVSSLVQELWCFTTRWQCLTVFQNRTLLGKKKHTIHTNILLQQYSTIHLILLLILQLLHLSSHCQVSIQQCPKRLHSPIMAAIFTQILCNPTEKAKTMIRDFSNTLGYLSLIYH